MLEELLALGHSGAEYDAWLIDIRKGDQFTSGFVKVNPNSKIPPCLIEAKVKKQGFLNQALFFCTWREVSGVLAK